jgi:hypothetical protein
MSRPRSARARGIAFMIVLGLGAAGMSTRAAAEPKPSSGVDSSWIGTAELGPKNEFFTPADGDLWPSCWASDGALYTAWGDGRGFDLDGDFHDIGTARIVGDDPAALSGTNTAVSDDVSRVWTDGGYSRKPTGMGCVGNTLYLAVQDLSSEFDDAPAATIVKSTDGGKSWDYDKAKPMFTDHVFTTMWFADFGRGGKWDDSKYVYVYGIDGNWRDSYRDRVPDPEDVYLARVPRNHVQDRQSWQFFDGFRSNGETPQWTRKIEQKRAVLHDSRRVYQDTFEGFAKGGSTVIAQGHVLYNEPLDRYIYSTWDEFGHHFYESPKLWGPWKRMADRDYTMTDEPKRQYGGYGTTLPSRFLSADGKTMLLQSNRCCSLPNAHVAYNYSLRPFRIEPKAQQPAANPPDGSNLARAGDTVALSKSVRQGTLDALNDGKSTGSLDDNDGEVKNASFWGYTWPRNLMLNSLTFTTGSPSDQGGWFIKTPQVQVRRNGSWVDVAGPVLSPKFKPGKAAGHSATYKVQFPAVQADGIRVAGVPGGDRRFTSMAEIKTSYVAGQLIDGGFENTTDFAGAWTFDGDAPHGLDSGGALSHSGDRNAWVRTQSPLGQQLLTQRMVVTPGKTINLSAWLNTSKVVTKTFLGARWKDGQSISEFDGGGKPDTYVHRTSEVTIPAGVHEIEIVVGYSADGGDAILQVDDVAVGS